MISKTVLFAFAATTLIVAAFALPNQDKDIHSAAPSSPVAQVTPSLNKTINNSNGRVRRDGGGGGGGGLGGGGGGGGGGRGGGGGGGGGGRGGGGGGGGGK